MFLDLQSADGSGMCTLKLYDYEVIFSFLLLGKNKNFNLKRNIESTDPIKLKLLDIFQLS